MAINRFTANSQESRGEGEKNIKAALELDPLNGHILCDFAAFHTNISPPMAMSTIMRAIDLYDGEKIEYSLWVQLGQNAVINGAAAFARVCFRMAIYLNPSYGKAYKCLDELEAMLAKLEADKGSTPPGFVEGGGGMLVPDRKIIEVVK